MASMQDQVKSTMHYFGAIQDAVQSGATAANVWDSIRAVQANEAAPVGGFGGAAVMQLVSTANKMFRASQAFNAADPDDVLTGGMVGTAPWSLGEAASAATTSVMAIYELVMDVGGGQESTWVRTRIPISPGMTVGDIMDAIDEAGEAQAQSYGKNGSIAGTYNGVDSISLSWL